MRFRRKLSMPLAVLMVLAFFLVVDGFLFYRYQQNLYTAGNDTATQSGRGIDATGEEATVVVASSPSEKAIEPTDEEAAVFTHLSTSETIEANSTYVDHPLANENPNAILLVGRGSEPAQDSGDFHNIGIWYDANRSKWAVFNQDRVPMSSNTAFEISILEEPSADVFVHRATSENTVYNETYVDHPLTNENPDAVLSITPNWNPGGGAGIYNNHPVGVRYDAEEAKWVILNQDLGAMPEGAAFNVAIS